MTEHWMIISVIGNYGIKFKVSFTSCDFRERLPPNKIRTLDLSLCYSSSVFHVMGLCQTCSLGARSWKLPHLAVCVALHPLNRFDCTEHHGLNSSRELWFEKVSSFCFLFLFIFFSLISFFNPTGTPLLSMWTSRRQWSRKGRTQWRPCIRRPTLAKFPSCCAPPTASWMDWPIVIWQSWTSAPWILVVTLSSTAQRKCSLLRKRWPSTQVRLRSWNIYLSGGLQLRDRQRQRVCVFVCGCGWRCMCVAGGVVEKMFICWGKYAYQHRIFHA